MELDIKKIIDQVAEKIKGNGDLMSEFQKNPIQAVESIIGVDLPDDKLEGIVAAVKAKLSGDEGKTLLGMLGGIFGKKE